MRALLSTLLAGCGVAAALGLAAPATAQYFPGYIYGYGYGPSPRAMINACARAVDGRLGQFGGRILAVRQVAPNPEGGITVRGFATVGGGYEYGETGPQLNWRCRTDGRGVIRQVDVDPVNALGYYNAQPQYYDDFSEYGYHRY